MLFFIWNGSWRNMPRSQTDINEHCVWGVCFYFLYKTAQSKCVFCLPPPLSSLALEEETDSMSQNTADTLPEDDRPEDTSERDALLGCSGTPEVEDSFL